MIISSKKVWVIMSKDRTLIAKGNVRDRYLVPVSDEHDIKRILTYSTKGRAVGAFKTSGFYRMDLIRGYHQHDELEQHLEAVEVDMQMVSADEGELPTNWISTKDRLPEIGVEVEIFTWNAWKGKLMDNGMFYYTRTLSCDIPYADKATIKDVHYWRPIES